MNPFSGLIRIRARPREKQRNDRYGLQAMESKRVQRENISRFTGVPPTDQTHPDAGDERTEFDCSIFQ